MFYKVIHHPTGNTGVGNCLTGALAEAIGAEKTLKLIHDMPMMFQSGYLSGTIVPPQLTGQRRTAVSINAMYEVQGLYTEPHKRNLILTIYRARTPEPLKLLPEHGPTQIATVAKRIRKQSQPKGT